MVKIIQNGEGVSLEDTDDFMKAIEKRVYEEFVEKKIVILNQGTLSDRKFKALFEYQYSMYKKELKKLLRTAYRNVFNPIKTIEGLEYIWCKYVFIGVLSEEYVIGQRDRMYKNMQFPDVDIKNKVIAIKNKINKRFKNP